VDSTSEILADLGEAKKALQLPGEVLERDVWLAYLNVEKSIALLKASIDFETPGVFVPIPRKIPSPRDLLPPALEKLEEGIALVKRGDFQEAIVTLRTSRNGLRFYLVEAGRSRARERRAARTRVK
jgi:hypothetical protein